MSKEEQDTYGAVMWEVKAGGGKVPLTTTSISLTESDVYWMVRWWEGQVQRSELKVVMVVMGRGGVSDAGEGRGDTDGMQTWVQGVGAGQGLKCGGRKMVRINCWTRGGF